MIASGLEVYLREHKTIVFIVAVLYSLDDKWRGIGSSNSFEKILFGTHGPNIHSAWKQIVDSGILGEFGKDFDFDPLYSGSNLSHTIQMAVNPYGLIRLGGSDLSYHVDLLSEFEIENLLDENDIDEDFVDEVAFRLSSLLEQEEAKSSTTS